MRTVGFILVGIKEDEMKFVGEDQASGGYIFFSEYMSSAKIFNEYSTCQEEIDFGQNSTIIIFKASSLR